MPVVDLDTLIHESAAADAVVLNDLAATTPDESIVPAFDASGVRWDIDVRTYADHPRVRYYLVYFQGPARNRMEIFLRRSARFEPMIRARFQAEGLPGDLGYLALIESGYSSEAVSRAYAVGMWQFMRGTGKGYGLRVDSWVDERRDPGQGHRRRRPASAGPARALRVALPRRRRVQRRRGQGVAQPGQARVGHARPSPPPRPPIRPWPTPPTGGGRHDAGRLDEGDGRGRIPSTTPCRDARRGGRAEEEDVDAAPDADGITSDAAFFRLASNDLLAAETQDYVPKLIAAALIAKAPAHYGFAVPAPAPFAYDSLVVDDATGLDVVARLAGTSVAELRELNPQYLRLVTPPRSTMVIRLPAGTGPAVAEGYAELSPKARVHYMTHVVGGARS